MQGDVISIFNENGEDVAGYVYDAWGNIITITGEEELANLNPYRYRGYFYKHVSWIAKGLGWAFGNVCIGYILVVVNKYRRR